ncbi:MAG: Endolytic peptidoglycan transglycosylase RlpA [Pseudomonadota bacterium]|nr:Endolytic peptidoglycan transglycosylase RlpA [Pseudomonadota bacterium]
MSKSWSHALLFASLTGVLTGCSTVPEQPVQTPANSVSDVDLSSDEPIPQVEPPSRSGNPDTYVVFGRRYRVKETSAGHRETGIASWYGWDFHGRKTSSGPAFNMFEITAAHKSLPIPTYARVTNLENGLSLVVKINDRGPFSGERILDLSYAAAARLDMLDQGTAKVEIVALAPYQFLPKLAAKRAEERERVASRAAELISQRERRVASRAVELIRQQEKVAAIHFAHEKPVAGRTSGKPPAAVQEKALRLAKNTASVKENGKNAASAKIQLASAAPVAKEKPVAKDKATVARAKDKLTTASGKPTPKPAPKPAESRVAAADDKRSALYVVGTVTEHNSARQVQNRLSSQMQRTVQVDSGTGKRYEVRVPVRNSGEAKRVAMQLASLGVSGSRVIAY